VPAGPFDVVLLLETMLAFPDKATLVQEIASSLAPGGRFAFTLEEGQPLTDDERARMPDADTVWLTPLPDLLELLRTAGLRVLWQQECTASHLAMVDALTAAFVARAPDITEQVGQRAFDELLAAHRLWSTWLGTGRVRKFAVVADKPADGAVGTPR
jgi:SAM-dependent methyltransferase